MSSKKILDDAEDLKIKNKRIISIGEKITSNKFPKYQFMGIIKIKLKDYRKMFKVYRKLKNKKIDFTNFLNILIKRYNFNIFAKPTSNFWLEIDSDADLKVAKFLLNEKNKLKKGKVFWITGFSGSGKTEIANKSKKFIEKNTVEHLQFQVMI